MKLMLFLAMLAIASPALATGNEDEKIDPETFICAELVATSTDTTPPLFEGLQLDGYAAGLASQPIADAAIMEPLLLQVYDSCSAKPTEKAIDHWQALRKKQTLPDSGAWRADKTTCGDYAANEDDGSGFVIWLDGYQRAKTGKKASILKDQATLDHFLAVCKANPGRLMYDVMVENAK